MPVLEKLNSGKEPILGSMGEPIMLEFEESQSIYAARAALKRPRPILPQRLPRSRTKKAGMGGDHDHNHADHEHDDGKGNHLP